MKRRKGVVAQLLDVSGLDACFVAPGSFLDKLYSRQRKLGKTLEEIRESVVKDLVVLRKARIIP